MVPSRCAAFTLGETRGVKAPCRLQTRDQRRERVAGPQRNEPFRGYRVPRWIYRIRNGELQIRLRSRGDPTRASSAPRGPRSASDREELPAPLLDLPVIAPIPTPTLAEGCQFNSLVGESACVCRIGRFRLSSTMADAPPPLPSSAASSCHRHFGGESPLAPRLLPPPEPARFDRTGRLPFHQVGQAADPRYLWPRLQVRQPPLFGSDMESTCPYSSIAIPCMTVRLGEAEARPGSRL